jgi:DNA-directed RNA polymerase specialized sigma24 family protein
VKSHERLFGALAELRASGDVGARAHRDAWGIVTAYVRRLPPPGNEDLQQETTIRLVRSVAGFAGGTDAEAAAWVRQIHKRGAIDGSRARGRDPVTKALAVVTGKDLRGPLDDLASEPELHAAEALDLFRDRLFDALDECLRETESSPQKRHLRRLEARAAFLRIVYELDAGSLRTELGEAAAASSDAQLYKWVERGRAVLADAAAALQKSGSPLGEDALETIRELANLRRSDAGRSRSKSEVSVSPPATRASQVRKPDSEKDSP